MNDYSLEYRSKDIISKKTQEYFKEVISSYNNHNFRAAIVTLYSVVISDLLLKLENLDEIYSDVTAKSILDEIKSFQETNPTSGDWEKDIVEKIKTRTNLLNNIDFAHILALRNDRHFCAHPVINNKEQKLYTPSKEAVGAHIRNMLDSLLTKPPILSKKILRTIIIDIADKKNILIDQESFEKYVLAKYLNNLNPSTEIILFRGLWKFIFSLDNQECNENKRINYRLLECLYNRNTSYCRDIIESEQAYFSNILAKKSCLNYFVRFISNNDFLYNSFREDVKQQVSKHVENSNDAKVVAWFLNDSFLGHIEILKKLIENDFNGVAPYYANSIVYKLIVQIGEAKGYSEQVFDFLVWIYVNAKNYNVADEIYAILITPNLSKMSKKQILELCKEGNNNPQVYSRQKAVEDHEKLKKFIESKFEQEITLVEFSNMFK
jgi:hypothetical protein